MKHDSPRPAYAADAAQGGESANVSRGQRGPLGRFWPACIHYGRSVSSVFVHTVVETPAFLAAADRAGLTRDERALLVSTLARDPASGEVIVGTGGCRKLRVRGRGKGKSGGYRVVTFFTGPDLPVFLLTVFGKGERADLTQDERNRLAGLTKQLVETYRTKAFR
jgi:hypothetical protein